MKGRGPLRTTVSKGPYAPSVSESVVGLHRCVAGSNLGAMDRALVLLVNATDRGVVKAVAWFATRLITATVRRKLIDTHLVMVLINY
jgi:hypothetical protein